MTKSDRLKLGIVGGVFLLTAIVLVWYFFLSSPAVPEIEPAPSGTPNTQTPTGAQGG